MGLDKLFVHHDLHPVHIDSKTLQNPFRHTAVFRQQTQQDMAGADQVEPVRIRKGFGVFHSPGSLFSIGDGIGAFCAFPHPRLQFPQQRILIHAAPQQEMRCLAFRLLQHGP